MLSVLVDYDVSIRCFSTCLEVILFLPANLGISVLSANLTKRNIWCCKFVQISFLL
jgi:hypothetical protein